MEGNYGFGVVRFVSRHLLKIIEALKMAKNIIIMGLSRNNKKHSAEVYC